VNNSATEFESGLPTAEAEVAEIRTQVAESQSEQPLPTGLEHRKSGPQRSNASGQKLSIERRTEIAIAACTSGLGGGPKETQQEIAKRFGVSEVLVKKLNNSSPDVGKVDEAAVAAALAAARDKALDRLMVSLGLLTEEKIEVLDGKDVAKVAEHMARIVEKTMPDSNRGGNMNVVIYAPEQKTEKHYKSVEV
jgi:hypothetical protein